MQSPGAIGRISGTDVTFELTQPYSVQWLEKMQPLGSIIGRDEELMLCRAAWGLTSDGVAFRDDGADPMHFRLEGPPGVGKNALVYELALRLQRPVYIVQGHEDLTPEDLALSLIPKREEATGFSLRAGPLASGIYTGGLVFFDEINRVPQRTLAQLASVLDVRQAVFSGMANVWIDRHAEAPDEFRFCCAMNDSAQDAGELPDYIEERTLPALSIGYLGPEQTLEVIRKVVNPSKPVVDAYRKWHKERDISTRVAIHIARLAMLLHKHHKRKPQEAIQTAADHSGVPDPSKE